MLRGRIVQANGVPVEDLKPSQSAAWVLQSDRGITIADEIPAGSRLVAGEWWPPDYDGDAVVSFEKRIADGLGLKVGDAITVNVLGRNLAAKVANLRAVDWQSLGINFVLVFSPNSFRGAPMTYIATLTYPGGSTTAEETALLKAVADAFPAITTVRVREAIDAVASIVTNLVLAHPRRQRAHAACGRAGARRRARGRPPAPRLRRRGAQDARRDAGAADCRLCARISADRLGHRAVRRRRRLGRSRLRGHPDDESVVYLARRAWRSPPPAPQC